MHAHRPSFPWAFAAFVLIATGPIKAQIDFVAAPPLSVGSALESIRVDDLNGDGVPDMAAKNGGSVALLLSTCQQGFAAPVVLGDGQLASSPNAFALGDMDGDGLSDIVVASGPSLSTTAVLKVVLNQGEGQFGPVQSFAVIPTGVPGITPLIRAATLVDMDGDGDLDVAMSMIVNGFVNGDDFYSIVLNQTPPGGPLAFASAVNIAANQSLAGDILAADLDNDGDTDLALPHLYDVSVTVFLNDGTGTAGSVTKEGLSGTVTTGPLALASGDINADGFLDVVALRPQGYSVLLNLDGGTNPANAGKLRSQPQVPVGASGDLATDIGMADFDRDGTPDLAISLSPQFGTPGSVLILPGTGSAAFGAEIPFVSGPQYHTLVVADLNGDTDPDLAAGEAVPGTIQPLANQVLTPWLELGQALAGTNGDPCATGTGSAEGGSLVTLRLHSALANSTDFLLVSPAMLATPFKGGVVVPDLTQPTLLILPFPVDASGKLRIDVIWPTGLPAGLQLFLQHWIQDAGGAAGFAASNALSLTTP